MDLLVMFMDTEEILCEILFKWANAYNPPSHNRDMLGR